MKSSPLARRIALATLYALFLILYLSSGRGVVGCNDGSQMALVRALGEEGRFAITNFVEYTKKVDYTFYRGNFYSDRPPGLSLLLAAPYWLAHQSALLFDLEVGAAAERAIETVLALHASIGAFGVAVLCAVLLSLGLSLSASVFTAFCYGAGSLHWKYSALFMAHAPSATLLLCILWLLLAGMHRRSHRLLFFLCLGFLPLVRYEAIVLVPFLLMLWLIERGRLPPATRAHSFSEWSLSALVFLLPLLLLAYYQTVCFGAPWQTYMATYAPDRNYFGDQPIFGKRGGGFSYGDVFFRPFLAGLYKVLFQFPGVVELPVGSKSIDQGAWGILILQPVLPLSAAGLFHFWRECKARAAILSLMSLAFLCLIASSWILEGGGMRDVRFLLLILPILYLPLGYLLDYLGPCRSASFATFRQLLVFYAFALASGLCILLCVLHFIETDDRNPIFTYTSIAANSLISREFILTIAEQVFLAKYSYTLAVPVAVLGAMVAWLAPCVLFRLPPRLLQFPTGLLAIFLAWLCYQSYLKPERHTEPSTIQISGYAAALAVQERDFAVRRYSRARSILALRTRGCWEALEVRPRSRIEILLPGVPLRFYSQMRASSSGGGAPAIVRFSLSVDERLLWSVRVNSRTVRAPARIQSLPAASRLRLGVRAIRSAENARAFWCRPTLQRA